MAKAIFIDRDGTINLDTLYVYKLTDLVILPGVIEGLSYLESLGYLLVLVTNQSGVSRGYYKLSDVHTFNKTLERVLGIDFDEIFICPHLPDDGCSCRKPLVSPDISQYIIQNNIDLSQSYMIGDAESDIAFGKNLGLTTIKIKNKSDNSTTMANYSIDSLGEISTYIH